MGGFWCLGYCLISGDGFAIRGQVLRLLICEFSGNFQKLMSFIGLRCCGKRVRGIRSIFEVDVENFPLDVAVQE